MSEQHHTEITSSLDKQEWRARCTCGYAGPIMSHKSDANFDADEHVIIMTHAED